VKITVDSALCTGHGRCYSLAPDIFEPDDEGYNAQRDSSIDVSPDDEESAVMAVHSCPEGAITMVEG
jgi:ferredoxin